MHRHLPPTALCLALLLSSPLAPVASASCFASEPFTTVVATASVVFVGTVRATTDEGRVARVRVDAVWRGFDLPAIVVVNGAYAPPGSAAPTPPPPGVKAVSAEDLHYIVGNRYLFLPLNGTSPFVDSPCTFTRPFTPDLEQYAPTQTQPPDQHIPTPPPFPSPAPIGAAPAGEGAMTLLLLMGILFAAAGLTAAVVRRR